MMGRRRRDDGSAWISVEEETQNWGETTARQFAGSRAGLIIELCGKPAIDKRIATESLA